MDKVDDMCLVKKRAASLEGSMNSFPEEVIGIILSHMKSARNLVMAASTCHKWHDASVHHLQRLTFCGLDFAAGTELYKREIIITKAVMQTSRLCELSIWMDESDELHPATVIAWLLHTKNTLKSLTFGNRIEPRLNILETLGARVESLFWRFVHIPTINPTTGSFKSLVSLILADTLHLTAENLKALLTVCPKLQSLFLMNISFSADQTGLLDLQSSSLKILFICQGLEGTNKLVLHAEILECVSLSVVNLELFKLVQVPGNSVLRRLFIIDTDITELDFGEAANSLLDLKIDGTDDLTAEWLKYYEVISRASNLKKLQLCSSSIDMRDGIDIHKIAVSFSRLYALSLDYEYAWECFTSHDSGLFPIFEKLAVLELRCYKIREGFAQWIAGFLEHSPSLKQLKIYVDADTASLGSDEKSRFTSSMVQIMRPYPCVDLSFDFSC